MNKNFLTKIDYIVFFALSLFTFHSSFFTKAVSAQARIPLVVAPSRQTVALDPGGSQNLQIRFFNYSDSPMAGTIKAVNFYVAGKDGAPILLEDMPNEMIKLSIDRAVIPVGDVLRVNFKVEVPENAKPGGSYAAIIFEQTGQIPQSVTGTESVSSVSPRVVGLVSIRINGPVVESAFIDAFKVPVFLEFGKIPVYFEILNKGGYHINPAGQVTLTNWMGNEIDRVTIDDKNIFPEARRTYEHELGKKWMFGRYKVDLTASYGESGKVLTRSTLVWVIPITLILVTLLAGIIISLTVYIIYKKVKQKQEKLEEKLEEEISELEALKNKFKDKLPK